jgi:hypothetical protein
MTEMLRSGSRSSARRIIGETSERRRFRTVGDDADDDLDSRDGEVRAQQETSTEQHRSE